MTAVRGRLQAGPDLDLDFVRFGDGGGPVVTVLGGVHGDEMEGVLAAYRVADLLASTPLRGTVTVLPRANRPPSRQAPGTATATPTSRGSSPATPAAASASASPTRSPPRSSNRAIC